MIRGFKIDYNSVLLWSMIKASVTVSILMGTWFLLSGEGLTSRIVLHLLVYFVGTSVVFIALKRNEIWYGGILHKDELYEYVFLSACLSAGSYSIGGLAVILSGVIGPVPTVIAFVLEGTFTAMYSYLDVKAQIDNYNKHVKKEEEKNAGINV